MMELQMRCMAYSDYEEDADEEDEETVFETALDVTQISD